MVKNLSAGDNLPDYFNVVVEISARSGPVKYEIDKDTGILVVDRFMPVSMHYPCNYGYIPCTLAGDGDPLDVLVMSPLPIQPGAMVSARSIGLLVLTDESGPDSKILAVPSEKVCAEFAKIKTSDDISPILLDQIAHFFEQYKVLEPKKWVKVKGWEDNNSARDCLMESVKRYEEINRS